jgi:hypothetical protein
LARLAIADLAIDNHRMERASSFALRHMKNLAIRVDRDQLRRRIGEANLHYARRLTTNGETIRAMISGETFDPR